MDNIGAHRGITNLKHVFDPRTRVTFDHALHPDQRLDLGIQAVAHELKFSIGRDETYSTIVLEPRQPHTLMEFDVLHFDSFPSARPSSILEHDFVVESQAQLRHARKVTFHLDGTENLRAQHVAVAVDEKVQRFNHVQEDFVLAVADPFGTPTDGVGNSYWRPGLDL